MGKDAGGGEEEGQNDTPLPAPETEGQRANDKGAHRPRLGERFAPISEDHDDQAQSKTAK